MDKFLQVTTKSTRNELLMQLMQESKSTNHNVVLVVESLPTFINTSVSLAVFNAMLKQYPKNLYWYSNNLAIINFLKISNITSIWKPPINTQPSKLSEQLSTYVSQATSNREQSRPVPRYNPVQNTSDLLVQSKNFPSPVSNQNPHKAQNILLPKLSNLPLEPNPSASSNPTNQSVYEKIEDPQFKKNQRTQSKIDSRLYNTTQQIKQKLARNIALLPKFASRNAETLSLADDINQIQAPDFNNLDDLISKIETTKEALEKKHNKLNKNLLDSEISMDAKNNMGWGLVLIVGIFLLVVIIGLVWWFRGR